MRSCKTSILDPMQDFNPNYTYDKSLFAVSGRFEEEQAPTMMSGLVLLKSASPTICRIQILHTEKKTEPMRSGWVQIKTDPQT